MPAQRAIEEPDFTLLGDDTWRRHVWTLRMMTRFCVLVEKKVQEGKRSTWSAVFVDEAHFAVSAAGIQLEDAATWIKVGWNRRVHSSWLQKNIFSYFTSRTSCHKKHGTTTPMWITAVIFTLLPVQVTQRRCVRQSKQRHLLQQGAQPGTTVYHHASKGNALIWKTCAHQKLKHLFYSTVL